MPGFAPLPVLAVDQAVTVAHDQMRERASGVVFALKCRLPALDKLLMGGHQFDNFYVYAGASGSGKSNFLTLLEQDFCDSTLNFGYPKPFKILHFTFEMSAADEVVRMVSSKTKLSYGTLMSAEQPLNAHGEHAAHEALKVINGMPLFYVETSGNYRQIEATVDAVAQKFPDHQLIVTLDHTLLPEYLNEKDEVELTSKIARTGLRIRKKHQAMVIFLSQLNDKIENPIRIQTPAMHYPSKTDLHSSKAIYQNADVVGILHRPEMLNITTYGQKQFPTKDLIAFHGLKVRKGAPGMVRLRAKFAEGTIEQWDQNP